MVPEQAIWLDVKHQVLAEGGKDKHLREQSSSLSMLGGARGAW